MTAQGLLYSPGVEEIPPMRIPATPDAGRVSPRPEWLSVALSRSADECFQLFSQVDRIPEWLSIVRSAVITRRDHHGRAVEAWFIARLERAAIGYRCRYRYNARKRTVNWGTEPGASVYMKGYASFVPLGPKACLMTYALEVDLGDALPAWSDASFQANAASSAINDFHEFVQRQ
jgi:ribosome-associated toxin RatA of RatAB toxin-antitoxin module